MDKMYVVQQYDSDGLRDTWQDLRGADPTEDFATAVRIRDRAKQYGKQVRIIERTETVIE